MNALSLFASGGIADMGLSNAGIKVKVANELLPTRVQAHKFWHPNCEVVAGDITKPKVRKDIVDRSLNQGVNFVMITPPCQAASLVGLNKNNDDMVADTRNFLVFSALKIVDAIDPDFVMMENVSRFFTIVYNAPGKKGKLIEILKKKYGKKYVIDGAEYNTADYGVPQSRKRYIVRMWKKGLDWKVPSQNETRITVREAIGNLPSLKPGQSSKIKNHSARRHDPRQVKWMSQTPTGKSAMDNLVHYPVSLRSGERVKAYSASYKRIAWDAPCPTITMRNDCISSQSNVHPGRRKRDGTYSDARVLSLRELFILSSIDPDLDVPSNISDIQIRHMVGEAVPPLLIQKIASGAIGWETPK